MKTMENRIFDGLSAAQKMEASDWLTVNFNWANWACSVKTKIIYSGYKFIENQLSFKLQIEKNPVNCT